MIEVQDRTEINKLTRLENFVPPFFSVLLPELGRPQYLKNCVNSVHTHADLPVEIIVHDDGSGKDKQRILFEELRDKVSTFVFNNGHNTGLARSFNRCRAMASSPYLLAMNVDTYLTSPFLKNMKAALDLPFIGTVNVIHRIDPGPGVYTTPEGIRIALRSNMGSFHCAGIRSEVWDAAGGWNENVQSMSSDVGFAGHIFSLGLFSAFVEGTVVNEMWPISEDGKTNCGYSNPEYIESWPFGRGDNNIPPIFKMDQDFHTGQCYVRAAMGRQVINEFISQNPLYPTWYNHGFQCKLFDELFLSPTKINWDKAKEYGFGHDRWRDQMIQDFKLEA
jgi:glycosyltransferase involved in cell wall biosynthesis